jgi:hypothetical protein
MYSSCDTPFDRAILVYKSQLNRATEVHSVSDTLFDRPVSVIQVCYRYLSQVHEFLLVLVFL